MPRKKKPKDTFVFRDEWLDWIFDKDYEWSADECKELLSAIRNYRKGLDIPKASSRYMNDKIKECIQSIEATDRAYEEKCESNRQRAFSRWNGRDANASTGMPTHAAVCHGVPEYAEVCQSMHDNDSDSDNEYDYEYEDSNESKRKINEKKVVEEASLFQDENAEKDSKSKSEAKERIAEAEAVGVQVGADAHPQPQDSNAVHDEVYTGTGESKPSHTTTFQDAQKVGDIFQMGEASLVVRGPRKYFKIPSVAEIEEFVKEKGYNVDAQYFFDYYNNAEPPWTYLKGSKRIPISSWKQCVVTFSKLGKRQQPQYQHNQSKGYENIAGNQYEQF